MDEQRTLQLLTHRKRVSSGLSRAVAGEGPGSAQVHMRFGSHKPGKSQVLVLVLTLLTFLRRNLLQEGQSAVYGSQVLTDNKLFALSFSFIYFNIKSGVWLHSQRGLIAQIWATAANQTDATMEEFDTFGLKPITEMFSLRF